MAQAALDHADFGARDQAQHFGRLLPHGLGARVAGEMEGDRTVERTEAGRQPLLLGDVDDVFSNVEGGIGHFLDCWIVWDDQRPFEFEHQRAGRNGRASSLH